MKTLGHEAEKLQKGRVISHHSVGHETKESEVGWACSKQCEFEKELKKLNSGIITHFRGVWHEGGDRIELAQYVQ
jgi:hypothetical protein